MRMADREREGAVTMLTEILGSDSLVFTIQNLRPTDDQDGDCPYVQMAIYGEGCSCLLSLEDRTVVRMLEQMEYDFRRKGDSVRTFIDQAKAL